MTRRGIRHGGAEAARDAREWAPAPDNRARDSAYVGPPPVEIPPRGASYACGSPASPLAGEPLFFPRLRGFEQFRSLGSISRAALTRR